MIAIVDCRIGNTGSIANMLRKCGIPSQAVSLPGEVERAEKLILPGVGSFDHGMHRLRELDLVSVLSRRVVGDRVPILGICLGLQLFTERSEEGKESGLGWVAGQTVRFRFPDGPSPLRVPHMGWNTVAAGADGDFSSLDASARFYFVHSYHVICRQPADVLATTRYGYDFASVVRHDNIVGVQFHPEKSHRFGLAFLREFATR